MPAAKLRPLKLADFKKIKERSMEASFERTLAACLHECGRESWHMSMREKGWPDRYVAGGIWIEIKSLKRLGKDNQTSKAQRTKMNMLLMGGERVFYLAKFEDSVILKPWREVRECTDLATIERYHYRTKEDLKEAIRYELD